MRIRTANALAGLLLLVMPTIVRAADAPREAALDLKAEAAAQYQTLVVHLANRAWFERGCVVEQAADAQALILKEDRDPLDIVLRRTKVLLADVKARGPRYDLAAAEAALRAVEARAQKLPAGTIAQMTPAEAGARLPSRAVWAPVKPPPARGPRYELFLEVCAARRQIALANPLLDFNQLLFIQRIRHPHLGHMCTYPGADDPKPEGAGGGLFVLTDPFGATPTLHNVLAEAANQPGEWQGLNLARPTICSFDLSPDGRTVVFGACVPPSREPVPSWFRSGRSGYIGHWSLFRVNVDGSGFARLTGSPFNDFDPCFLPDGRLVFISERRGGYGRCHGDPFPTYTLHGMNADGSDIVCLSFHETNEWNPSVGSDGKIIYTRWDYVDRDTNAAHHLWTCFADGRDPRSLHGNYPLLPPERQRKPGETRFGQWQERRFGQRPWGEWSCRAVPGREGVFVATAGGHHGCPTCGSLILVATDPEDDDEASQFRRLTPEAPFPEAEQDSGGPMNREFGWAWPLSDRYCLCAYDAELGFEKINYGIYLVDVYGNKELIYRDPAMSSIFPMPLRARAGPPAVPPQAADAKPHGEPAARPATIAVMNVYESDFAWPAGTRITALRLIQVLPKTAPRRNDPRIGMASQAGARAVLGTVPVESDGSAYFEAPAGKQFFFQALDERGLAVESMRSATYVQPGERMTCLGCHEPKRATRAPDRLPAALRRPPSPIRPDVDGSNPFSYVRLVQPVLDRHCVACHREKKASDLSGAPFDAGGDKRKRGFAAFTQSYMNLAPKYGFWFDSEIGCATQPQHGGIRAVAGQFGAKASRLLTLLDKGHHDLKLPPEDLYRLTLWLDCNSDFYGAYHSLEAQLRGEIVKPDLE